MTWIPISRETFQNILREEIETLPDYCSLMTSRTLLLSDV